METELIQQQIDDCTGLCIEIGGPSPNGYRMITEIGLKLPAKILVTNIANPIILNPFGENPTNHKVDAIVDINNPPYAKNSVDIILTSSLPNKLHAIFFENAAQMLRQNGLLIIENELLKDKNTAFSYGFKPLVNEKIARKFFSQIYQLT